LKLKVSVIGASGRVGSTAAFGLAEEDAVDKLVLISRKKSIDKIKGESLDMYDALAAKGINTSIKTSHDLKDVKGSRVIVLSAGVPRNANMSRMDLAMKNAKIVSKYSKKIAKFSPDSVLLIVTNPVDIMTYVALKSSRLAMNKVIGIGNHLDSLRLKSYMAKHFKIHVSEVHTRIIGEHGDNMVPLISSTTIGGILLNDFSNNETFKISKTLQEVKDAGTNIIGRKKATEYGPAFAISNIVTTILKDENRILTVTSYLNGEIEGIEDVCLGIPVILGSGGIKRIIPIKMNAREKDSFIKASKIVRKASHEIMESLS
jgi:malate dehydrogenase